MSWSRKQRFSDSDYPVVRLSGGPSDQDFCSTRRKSLFIEFEFRKQHLSFSRFHRALSPVVSPSWFPTIQPRRISGHVTFDILKCEFSNGETRGRVFLRRGSSGISKNFRGKEAREKGKERARSLVKLGLFITVKSEGTEIRWMDDNMKRVTHTSSAHVCVDFIWYETA